MELVKASGGRRKGCVRRDAQVQLCEVGDRLDYVLRRYARLVRELGDGSVAVPDLAGRVELVNSQLVYIAQRLQELLILESETARAAADGVRSGKRAICA